MPKKYNNSVLLIILIVLIAGWFLTRFFKSERNKRNFKTDIVSVDTSSVKSLYLYPKTLNGQGIKFDKKDNQWQITFNDITDDADQDKIKSMLSQLISIKATRLAARSETKWEEFQLTDSLATRIEIIDKKGKKELDLLLGKFTYQQINPNMSSYNQNNIKGISYVRLNGENEIYAVDGFLNMAFNMDFKFWRNQQILKTKKNNITRLSFNYPADSGFVAMQKDSVWVIGNRPADPANFESYLTSLGFQSGSSFVDNYIPKGNADYQLIIDGNNMSQIIISGYRIDDQEVIINSSMNPDSYFSSTYDGVFSQIFKSREELVRDER